MEDSDFPALYRSANALSLKSQNNFFRALKLHLMLLIFAAIFSIINIPHWSISVFQLIFLLGALFCSVYLSSRVSAASESRCKSAIRYHMTYMSTSRHQDMST